MANFITYTGDLTETVLVMSAQIDDKSFHKDTLQVLAANSKSNLNRIYTV